LCFSFAGCCVMMPIWQVRMEQRDGGAVMRTLLVSTCMILLTVSAAFTGSSIPDPPLSTVEVEAPGLHCPGVALACPGGCAEGAPLVTVTVIDMYGMPIPNAEVECGAAWSEPHLFCFCPGEVTQVDTTDQDGVVCFVFDDFGGCGDLVFTAECRGVVLYPSPMIYICSPDCNADCKVSLHDFAIFASHYLEAHPCCDYDCDGSVTLADFGTFASHYMHECP
jgi:hypothetical protein